MAYEMIRFSFADPLLSQLKNLATEGESVHLTAKRLLSDFLGGDSEQIASSPDLLERLNKLESAIAAPSPDALAEIQERLEKLEAQSGDREAE